MKHQNMSKGGFFTNKMDIHFDMLCPLVLHRVRGHVDRTDIVALDDGGLLKWEMELK